MVDREAVGTVGFFRSGTEGGKRRRPKDKGQVKEGGKKKKERKERERERKEWEKMK